MTKERLAERLNGREYRHVPDSDDVREARESDLLIVYGASDDLCEFAGAFGDEADCYNGGEIDFDEDGVIPEWDAVRDDSEYEELENVRHYLWRYDRRKTIVAEWCEVEGYSWTYKTDLPHATFDVLDDGEKYCRGMVIDMRDVR